MLHKKKDNKTNYVLKAEPGKYEIILHPITLIREKIKILRNPKNLALSILGISICALIGLVFGGIIGTIVGFIISVALLFIIGPTKEKIIERNKKEIS
jgi:hypothetical protein